MLLEGDAAPPMANGEVVFEAPWQSRVFGLARSLCELGYYSWDEFREQLIQAVGEADEQAFEYFDCFLQALTRLLRDKELLESGELVRREREFAARPPGHDHGHEHSHDHDHDADVTG